MFSELRFYRLVVYIIDYIYKKIQNFLKLTNIILIFFKKSGLHVARATKDRSRNNTFQ
jgi:hypothetical protein